MYASLLVRARTDEGELSGVLTGLDEATVATSLVCANLVGLVLCAYFGLNFAYKVRGGAVPIACMCYPRIVIV